MRTWTLTVPGKPKGQPRMRAFAKKMGDKFVARVYDAGTAEEWKSDIALEARKAGLNDVVMIRPVALELYFHFKRPRTHFRTGRNKDVLRDQAPKYHHCLKPDLDNLLKAVKDCLTRINAWRDDSQVAIISASKRWAERDETLIKVAEM